MTDSPWAKEGTVSIKGARNPVIGAGGMRGNSGGVADVPGVAGVGGARAQPDMPEDGAPLPHILIRWDSAAPIYEACSSGGLETYLFSCYSKLLYLSGMPKKFDELAHEYYIIGMSNYPNDLSGRDRDAPQHSAAADAALGRMGERIRLATALKRKGKDALEPAKVLVLPAGSSLLVMLFFPRSTSVSLEDKEVSLESSDGVIEVRCRFKLKPMLRNGSL